MIIRIVKLTFNATKIEEFKNIFSESKMLIRNFEGCKMLHLLQDKIEPNVMFTYSIWKSEEDLERYRNSELFKSTWAKTKPLFDSKAEAWSVNAVETLN